jgi:alkylation response protein AidB-like acyl-CoA dehydrogenase
VQVPGQHRPDDDGEEGDDRHPRGTAIAGGSTFIQRNIVAERMLGLPRG